KKRVVLCTNLSRVGCASLKEEKLKNVEKNCTGSEPTKPTVSTISNPSPLCYLYFFVHFIGTLFCFRNRNRNCE
ncbi:unnamed protein product, partial [Prunus brigantina]